MQFVAKDEETDVISLTLRSEGQQDKIRILLLLAELKHAAGTDANAGSTLHKIEGGD
jgi:ssRNA-specific RNase YbeY (16S rRNA maturation enzyme)